MVAIWSQTPLDRFLINLEAFRYKFSALNLATATEDDVAKAWIWPGLNKKSPRIRLKSFKNSSKAS